MKYFNGNLTNPGQPLIDNDKKCLENLVTSTAE